MTAPAGALPLDSPRWEELEQAFGDAGDIARLLAHLDRVSDAERQELWFGLWRTLWREGEVFTASYAAMPHLVAYASDRAPRERAAALHLAGAVEVARHGRGAPELPGFLRDGYHAALRMVPELVASCAAEPWDADTAQVLAAVLAIAKGHPGFGGAALSLEPHQSCPVCGATYASPGWGAAG